MADVIPIPCRCIPKCSKKTGWCPDCMFRKTGMRYYPEAQLFTDGKTNRDLYFDDEALEEMYPDKFPF